MIYGLVEIARQLENAIFSESLISLLREVISSILGRPVAG